MKLSINERFSLLNIIPRENSRVIGKIVADFINDLQLSAEEYVKHGVKEEGQFFQANKMKPPVLVPAGQVMWNPEGDKGKEIVIDAVILDIIQKQFKQLDENKRLPIGLHDLYDRFMGAKAESKKKKKRSK